MVTLDNILEDGEKYRRSKPSRKIAVRRSPRVVGLQSLTEVGTQPSGHDLTIHMWLIAPSGFSPRANCTILRATTMAIFKRMSSTVDPI